MRDGISSATADDDALVEEVRRSVEGDTRAFEELVRRHERHVLANCRHLTRESYDAEDLAQEVFVKAFFALERFEGRSTFRTWLTRVKTNHCLNYLRARRGVSYVELDDPDDVRTDARLTSHATALHDLERRDQRARITAALDSLPDVLRIPLVLREVDGLAYEAIASMLGVGLSAVKMRIKRGRERFRQAFALLDVERESVA